MAIIARGQISVVTVDDGQSPVVYSLLPSCTAVHEDKAGVKTPSKISCRAVLAVGDQREVVGVDTKIAYKGRNLLIKSFGNVAWSSNGGASIDTQTFGSGVWRINNVYGNGYYASNFNAAKCNGQLVVGERYVLSYDIYVLEETRFGIGFGDVTNQQVYTNIGSWKRASAVQQYTGISNTCTAYCGKTAGQHFFVRNIKVEREDLSTIMHTPAPEDYTIKRNGQAYTAGVDVTPTNDTTWTLHEPLAGAVIDSETVPLILDGTDGANAPRLKVQFSINGSTLWHDTYAAEDRYRRESNDGGLTWGVAMRMWGETGAAGADGKKTPYTEFSYAYGIAQPTVWNDAPPAKVEGQNLWERIRKYTPKADNSGWDLASTSYAIINEYIESLAQNRFMNSDMEIGGFTDPGDPSPNIARIRNKTFLPFSSTQVTVRSFNAAYWGVVLFYNAQKGFITNTYVMSGNKWVDDLTPRTFNTPVGTAFIRYSIRKPDSSAMTTADIAAAKFTIIAGNRAPDVWSPAPEDIQSEIDSTKNSIADIFSDGKVTPDEKQQLKLRFDPIKLIHSQTVAKCTALGIDSAILVTSYTHLDSFITPILASMNTTSVASFDDINMRFKAWEVEYSAIQVRIAEKSSQNAIIEADRLAKAEAEAKRNEMAQSIGYDSWADLDAAAKAGETIIEGGKINATLIETAALVTKLLAADSGFIKQLIVESLKTPSGRVEINDAIGKFGSIRLANEDSISIVDEAENEIIKMLRGEIPSLEDLTSKNQNTTVNFVQNPPSSFNYGWQPISVSGWTTVSSGGLLTVNNDNTTVSIINTTGGVAPQMTVNCLAPASGDSISVELVAELRNATGGVWIIDTMTHSARDGFAGVKKIALTRTFYSMPKGTYSIAVKARIVSISGDAIAEYNYSTGRMSAVLVSAKNQSWFGRGLAVIRSATEWLHYGWRTVNGTKKWMLSYKGSIDFPGVLCAGRVNAEGVLTSSWGAKTVNAIRHNGLQGRVKIIHDLGHLNYFVTATMFSTGHQGPIVVMEKTTTYIVIGTGGLDGGWWNVDFDFIICGQN